jgi:hypothetical protein
MDIEQQNSVKKGCKSACKSSFYPNMTQTGGLSQQRRRKGLFSSTICAKNLGFKGLKAPRFSYFC